MLLTLSMVLKKDVVNIEYGTETERSSETGLLLQVVLAFTHNAK